MAITESDYLHIHKGTSSYLLLRNATHFHLIRMDANLSESKMERLLRLYPCETDQLQKMGLHVSAFKADNLRGIVITGYEAGDTLELWLGGDIREYQLGSNYSEDTLTHFFAGHSITNRLPPKWEGLDRTIVRKVTLSVNSIAIACAIGFHFISIPYKLWSVLCIACQLAALVLTLCYPASFTLAEDTKKSKRRTSKGKGQLSPAFYAPAFALCLRTIKDFTFDDSYFLLRLLVSAIASLVLCGGYILTTKKLRNGLVNAIATVFVILFLSFGTVGQLNYLLDFDYVDRQVATVVDKQVTRHTRSTDYDCTVQLPNGELMELSISGRTYRKIEVGEDIVVAYHSGAFHIPFFIVEILSNTDK